MTTDSHLKPILICDTQPVAMEGVRWLLDSSGDLRCVGSVTTLAAASEFVARTPPAAVILDKSFGNHALNEWITQLRWSTASSETSPSPVVWGADITEGEALRFVQAGARGIIRRTAPADTMLRCLRAVISGATWMDENIFRDADRTVQRRPSGLTPREHQVAELVERGLRNRDISRQLGIQTGTVKIHLKHIFEKTGVRGRYGLAMIGLREKGTMGLPVADEVTIARGPSGQSLV